MKTDNYLLALIPNQQTRLKLQELRRSVFRNFGILSALSLEPLIPVSILSHKAEKDKIIRALSPENDTAAAPPKFTLSSAIHEGEYIFIDIMEKRTLSSIRDRLHEYSVKTTWTFPVYPGLFIAHHEGLPFGEILSFLDTSGTGPIEWSSSRAALYSISFPAGSTAWWEEVQWTMEWQFPFRKSLTDVSYP